MEITKLESLKIDGPNHHQSNGKFENPWNTSAGPGPLKVFKTRWNAPKAKPLPEEAFLVPVVTPDLSLPIVTPRLVWLGHASFLLQTASCNVLLDPVLVDHMSPFTFIGPVRFRKYALTMEQLPPISLVLISHNHYDHLDITTVQYLYNRDKCKFLVPLGVASWFRNNGMEAVDGDWWDRFEFNQGADNIRLTCCPSQHGSNRTGIDRNQTLWCSWALEMISPLITKKLFFAGDTGYRSLPDEPTSEQLAAAMSCPAFKQIGDNLGPFDLALLPIGCFLPRSLMSCIHASPEDSICIHKDVKAKRSLGMHYGTIRGSISQYYEEVLDGPKRLKDVCKHEGIEFGKEFFLCDIGAMIDI